MASLRITNECVNKKGVAKLRVGTKRRFVVLGKDENYF